MERVLKLVRRPRLALIVVTAVALMLGGLAWVNLSDYGSDRCSDLDVFEDLNGGMRIDAGPWWANAFCLPRLHAGVHVYNVVPMSTLRSVGR
jgi:hypothetical protein